MPFSANPHVWSTDIFNQTRQTTVRIGSSDARFRQNDTDPMAFSKKKCDVYSIRSSRARGHQKL